RCRAGSAPGGYGTNYANFLWSGTNVLAYIDTSNVGTIPPPSDYRIKQDVAPLGSTWDRVKVMRPVSYTHNGYSEQFPADGVERWGFIAHELQEDLLPTASTGEKDIPDQLQAPNPWALIAALTKALQEAMTRIELLEAKM